MTSLSAARLKNWSRQIGEFALGQGFGQAAGMLSGLIIVNVLSIDDYALYALGMTAIGFVTIGSDLGLSSAAAYYWRKSVLGEVDFDKALAEIKALRLILISIAAVGGVAFIIASTAHQQISTATLTGLCLATVLGAFLNMRNALDIQVMRLRLKFRESYIAEAVGSALRLVAASAMAALSIGSAILGVAINVLAAWAIATRIRTTNGLQRAPVAREGPPHRLDIVRYSAALFPSFVIFLIQEPLIMYRATHAGGSLVVAEYYALGRVGILVSVIGMAVNALILPKLAAARTQPEFLAKMLWASAAVIIFCVLLVVASAIRPDAFLMLIGAKYSHLQSEMTMALINASLGVAATVLIAGNRVRGWIRFDWLVAMGQTAVLLMAVSFADMQTSMTLLWVVASLHLFVLASAAVVFVIGVFNERIVRMHESSPERPA